MNLTLYQQQASITGDRVIMNLVKYQDDARSTAIYPNSVEFLYPALGLAGEAGELCEKIAEDAEDTEIIKEIGDVLWYVANVALDCGILMHTIFEGLDDFDQIEPIIEINMAAALAKNVGIVCEMAKKAARDDGGNVTDARREKVREALRAVLGTLAGVCAPWEFNLSQCAETNIAKLKSRQERGVLGGSGDNR